MMTSQTSRVAFGYPWTPYRIEHRPTYGPHTKEELQRLLDLLAEAGVRAWWYSVATKGSYPMFPSNYLPYRDDAVDYLPWLVKEAHARGIALFSWEYLTTAPLLAEAKPEWRWKFFDWDGPQIPRDKHYVCWNSPYGELLKKYCVEVVDELGFDGIWFDGAFMHGHGATGTFACCCDFCAAKYRKQTGRELPRTIDLREESVREYLEWRYSDHTEYWRDLSAYVRARDPQALIVFNYFNRFGSGIKAGSPLRRMAGDAPQWPDSHAHGPMEGMISTEVGHSPQQTMLLGKILRAVNDNYPVELWAYGRDTVAVGTPDPHPGPMLLHAYQCAAIGGFPSFGMGPLQGCRHLFPVLTAKLEPLAPYIPGIPEKTVGLVVSGCTKDYGYIDETHPDGQEGTAWNATLGMHNLLNALRLPSEVLLDNMLSDEFLTAFQAVVLPDVRCMSDDSGAALRRYVEHGGTLLAIGDTATHDELGRPRDQGLLDDLFGIVWRDQTSIAASLALESPLTSTVDPATGLAADGLPPTYQLPGALHLVRSESAEVLAAAKYNTQRERVFSTRGIKRPDGDIVEGAAILRRCVGSGQAIWVAPNIAEAYGRVGPNHYSRVLVDRLLTHINRPFTAEAPPNVVVNLIRQDQRVVLHVLNVPESLLTLGMDADHAWPSPQAPQDFVPTGPVRITMAQRWKNIESPTKTQMECKHNDGKLLRITIPRLERYAMIVLETIEA